MYMNYVEYFWTIKTGTARRRSLSEVVTLDGDEKKQTQIGVVSHKTLKKKKKPMSREHLTNICLEVELQKYRNHCGVKTKLEAASLGMLFIWIKHMFELINTQEYQLI